MKANRDLWTKRNHQLREERLQLAYSTPFKERSETYSVYNLEDCLVAQGVTLEEYTLKGWHLERFTLVKEN